jgi:hypothetical protein
MGAWGEVGACRHRLGRIVEAHAMRSLSSALIVRDRSRDPCRCPRQAGAVTRGGAKNVRSWRNTQVARPCCRHETYWHSFREVTV